MALLLLAVLAYSSTNALSEKPALLRAAEHALDGRAIRTAHVEYSFKQRSPNNPDMLHTRFYSWKMAGDDILQINRGDEEGRVALTEGWKKSDVTYGGPIHALLQDGEVWIHTDDAPVVRIARAADRDFCHLVDWRLTGVNPVSDYEPYDVAAARAGVRLDYAEEVIGDEHVVSASTDDSTVRWWINPEKGPSVTKTEIFVHGKLIGEKHYEWALVDGVWFPRRVEMIGLADGTPQIRAVTEVHYASLNQPEHPQSFSPADVGVEVGMAIEYRVDMNRPGERWDGNQRVPHAEFFKRLAEGGIRAGPTMSRESARLRAQAEARAAQTAALPPAATQSAEGDIPRDPSAWERYTEAFIRRYALDSAQAQRAWTICRDCQQAANEYLARRKDDVERIDVRLRELQDADPRATVARREAAAQLVQILRPVEEIFENRLAPRLESLPTRTQRAAAESQPAGK